MSLRVADLSGGYGAMEVLHGVSIEVRPGELVLVLGPNGAGKSTLLGTVAGLLEPSAGGVFLDGKEITAEPPEARIRAGLALVPEGRQLFGRMTVTENLMLGAHLIRRDRARVDAALERVFELFPVLSTCGEKRAESLSGGQQQMVAIARALMNPPRVLALDEPSLGLAPLLVDGLLESLTRLRDEGVAVLLVEQHAALALRHADRAYVLNRGRVVRTDSGARLIEDDQIVSDYLGAWV
jgi:branched-chain amino acid transport system ATP-binding protein